MPIQSADIVIVGGGVIGLSVARALALKGVTNVLLVERASLGREASFAAAGMLAPQVEADKEDDFFHLASESRDLYPAFATALFEETGVDVELDTTGTLFLALTTHDEEEIQKRYEWQTKAGLAVEKLSAVQACALEPCISSNVRAGLRFPRDHQVENRRLMSALAIACERYGITTMTDTAVLSLRVKENRIEGVETSRGLVRAPVVVIAGGAWTSTIQGLPDIPIEPVRGQMLCLQSRPKMARHVIYSPRGYLVPRRDGRLLAGSTTEWTGFDKTVSDAGMRAIRDNATEISPLVPSLPVLDSWAGLRPRAADNLPVLGPCVEIEGLVYATGHYRNGILLAPITGELIAGTIIDKVLPPLLSAFSANRFGLVPVS